MSSLTACPFNAVAAAAKSGFILLQNPHPIEEKDHSNQQCYTNVLHTVYFYDFLNWSNSFIAHFKTKVQNNEIVLKLENTGRHINWLIAFKKSMQR